jgi:hypothetical protein
MMILLKAFESDLPKVTLYAIKSKLGYQNVLLETNKVSVKV